MRRISLYIVLLLSLLLVIYLAFLDTLAKPVFEQLATEQYGAEVSVDRLTLQPFRGKATLYQLQVADRRDAMRNLVQADRVYVNIDIIKLAENVVDVSNMEIDGLVAFAPRAAPARILRPLVDENSGLAKIGLPSFDIPDVDRLLDQKRDALEAEIDALQQSFENTETRWKQNIDSIPDEDDIRIWKDRIRGLKNADKPLQALKAAAEVRAVFQEVNDELERLRKLRSEFRGDVDMLRQQIDLATQLPQKYTDELVRSLGLSSEQVAQLGRQLLRGDLDGLLQQVLAPLAFNVSGQADSQKNAMPVFVRRGKIAGSLLPAAAGLSVEGTLKDFAWPLNKAQNAATLQLNGSSLNGGELAVSANVDHRGTPDDRIVVNIDRLPLKNMTLAGSEQLAIRLLQTLANVSGELRIVDGKLDGAFTQRFTDTIFATTLNENAGRAARIIARMLESSNDFMLRIGFAGSLQDPQLSFASDMDKLIQASMESAISESVTRLTNELQLRLSQEIGPEIAGARDQFKLLEALQAELQGKLVELDQISR